MPPVSTSQKLRPAQSVSAKCRSRVVPASSDTMALSSPTMRLKSADLPTFGRPMSATTGTVMFRRWAIGGGRWRTWRLAHRPSPIARQYVDEVVRRMHWHRQLLAHGHERFVVEEDAAVVDLSLIHISEPTRLLSISYAVFCLKKKKK